MQDCAKASVNGIPRVNLEPKEEVVLVVRPDNLHYYTAESYLRNDDAIPNSVKHVPS